MGTRERNKFKLSLNKTVSVSNRQQHVSATKTHLQAKHNHSGFGGLQVACWPLVLKFAGSNPTEAVGFFRAKKKSSARLPPEGK